MSNFEYLFYYLESKFFMKGLIFDLFYLLLVLKFNFSNKLIENNYKIILNPKIFNFNIIENEFININN